MEGLTPELLHDYVVARGTGQISREDFLKQYQLSEQYFFQLDALANAYTSAFKHPAYQRRLQRAAAGSYRMLLTLMFVFILAVAGILFSTVGRWLLITIALVAGLGVAWSFWRRQKKG